MSCLLTWFSDPLSSSSACPTESCLCECVRATSARAEKAVIWAKQYQLQQKGKPMKKEVDMTCTTNGAGNASGGGGGGGAAAAAAAAVANVAGYGSFDSNAINGSIQGQQAGAGGRRVGFV